jgi:hypothetical protein
MPKQRRSANRTVSWLAVMLMVLVGGLRAARAGEADVAEKAETPQTSWYGWQTLISDGSAIGLLSLAYLVDYEGKGATSRQGYADGANLLFATSFATYLVGAPVIHWVHGQGRTGWASLGLRAGLPIGGAIAGALIGSAACGSSSNSDELVSCPAAFGAVGALAGVVAAPILDATVLAREPVMPPTGPRLQAATFVPSGGGGTFVLAGRF